jgi:WD40 repeat protein
VAISPDNRWLVTGSSDKTARLWDLSAKDPAANPVILRGHESWVEAVAISPDNHWVVTGSYDHTTRLWLLQMDDLVDLARTIVGRNFFADEWQRYFPGEKYRKTFDELPGPDESVTRARNPEENIVLWKSSGEPDAWGADTSSWLES